MELEVLKELFIAHLNPIQKDINELKQGQLQLIEITKIQVRHDEAIKDIKEDIDKCDKKVENMKETKNKKIWDVAKLSIAGFLGAILGKFF